MSARCYIKKAVFAFSGCDLELVITHHIVEDIGIQAGCIHDAGACIDYPFIPGFLEFIVFNGF